MTNNHLKGIKSKFFSAVLVGAMLPGSIFPVSLFNDNIVLAAAGDNEESFELFFETSPIKQMGALCWLTAPCILL